MKNNNLAFPYLPVQYTGAQTETSSSMDAPNETEARQLFQQACDRLNDINNWKELCGALSSDFMVMDEDGKPTNGQAAEGKFIRIDIPGPGTKAGEGYDWVMIEAIKHEIVSPTQEVYLIQARPSKLPGSNSFNIAHFLTDKATSSFVIILNGTSITATVFGRNEVPNSKDAGTLDSIRNSLIGSTGAIGVSKLQWKSLVDGVLGK